MDVKNETKKQKSFIQKEIEKKDNKDSQNDNNNESQEDNEDPNRKQRDKKKEFSEYLKFLEGELSPEALKAIKKDPEKMDEIIEGLRRKGELREEYDARLEKFTSKITEKEKFYQYK
jgi:hypothetical protein